MTKLTLTLLGRDSWSRPVYEGSDGSLYVDTDPRADRQPRICTKYRNAFDGEPDTPVRADVTFVPCRDTCRRSASPPWRPPGRPSSSTGAPKAIRPQGSTQRA